MTTALDLQQAAARFAARSDSFAAGKADICLDMAAKLGRYGTFVSAKQAEFAAKLVSWSIAAKADAPAAKFTRIQQLVQEKNLSLHLGVCKVVTFQSGAIGVVTPLFGGGTFGVIDPDGSFRRFSKCTSEVFAVLQDVERRGLEAVQEIGRATGRCCVCSRTLTNEDSIAAGIGPVCAERFVA
jgi:hypothetical protein